MTKKKSVFKTNKEEIVWNLINSGIAGILVFLGACSTGELSYRGLIVAIVAAGTIFVAKMRDYWLTQKKEYQTHIFNFIQM